jgi:hypothetical protein
MSLLFWSFVSKLKEKTKLSVICIFEVVNLVENFYDLHGLCVEKIPGWWLLIYVDEKENKSRFDF